jgi:hypothetical protein
MGSPDKVDDVLRAIAGQAEQPKYIRAYHGSPYDFDRFDARKIGSTEGTGYGFGHYFAQDEDVAKNYRDEYREVLALPVPRQLLDEQKDALSRMLQAREAMRQADPSMWSQMRRAADEAEAKFYNLQRQVAEKSSNPGVMYEVAIDQPESSLLDLDAPLSGEHKAAVLDAAFAAPQNKWQQMAIEEAASPATRASVALESLMRAYNVTQTNRIAGRLPSQAKVSSALFERGIPGATYADTFGRYSERGSRNYVMFPGTEDSIRILRKYGLMVPIAAGAGQEQR